MRFSPAARAFSRRESHSVDMASHGLCRRLTQLVASSANLCLVQKRVPGLNACEGSPSKNYFPP